MSPPEQCWAGPRLRVEFRGATDLPRRKSMKNANPLIICLSLGILACNPGSPDSYDPARMDLKPAPARVTSERKKGTFAEGGSLSLGAELKPLDPAPVKIVRLDTTHRIIEIAP
jgi:hypothetical protein